MPCLHYLSSLVHLSNLSPLTLITGGQCDRWQYFVGIEQHQEYLYRAFWVPYMWSAQGSRKSASRSTIWRGRRGADCMIVGGAFSITQLDVTTCNSGFSSHFGILTVAWAIMQPVGPSGPILHLPILKHENFFFQSLLEAPDFLLPFTSSSRGPDYIHRSYSASCFVCN
jgi:hypothetical protein